MITLYDPINNKLNISEAIDKNISKLCCLLKCDIVTLIKFSDNNKFVESKKIFVKKGEEYVLLKKEWMNVIEDSTSSILNLVKEKKQIVFYNNNNNVNNKYLPLTENASHEIYIPIFLDKKNTDDRMFCIYLANFNSLNNSIKIEDISQGEACDIICTLERLCQIKYLRRKRHESILNLINMMSEITREKEPYMILHPYNVAHLTTEITKSLNLDEETLNKLYFTGILHDIGKVYLDRELLNKNGALTKEEYEILKNHSVYGANIVRDVTGLDDISLFVRHHHERYDGTGYPDKLKAEEIPLESRIISIADAVDAMLSHRSYRSPQSVDFLIAELIKNKGKQFDPKLVDIVISLLIKTKEEINEMLSHSIVWSTLIINTDKRTYSIEGTLGKYDFGYFFKADKFNFLSQIDQSTITTVSLYINKNNTIIQYKLKLDYFEENTVHISEFKYIPIRDSFNTLWDLNGELHINSYNIYDVKICKLGGSSLMFSLDKKQNIRSMENKILNFKIMFENNKSVTVSGKIIRNFNVANTKYYEFTYIDVREHIIDEIYRQMFSRQSQLKGLINKYL